jgi:folate-binding protein YgfZ
MRPEVLRYNQSSMGIAAQDEPAQADAADTRAEFKALVSGCGIYRLDRAQIALTGSDRVRWLNGMVTNNIRDLAVGRGVYAFLLNPQGKIQADLYAFNRGESLLVETESAQVETVLQIFDRYIIMDDVEVENVSAKIAVIGLAGPKSEAVLANIPAPSTSSGQVLYLEKRDGQGRGTLGITSAKVEGADAVVARGDNPAIPNYEIWISPERAESIWNALIRAGAEEVHADALEALRIACGIPKFGLDIRQRDLPQETGQERALNFTKGCYVGQEIVERIRSRGAVHRMLTGFEIEGTRPAPGFRIQEDGKDVAEITSVATVPAEGGERTLALGYGRKEIMLPGKEFVAGDTKARVAGLPWSGIFPSSKD